MDVRAALARCTTTADHYRVQIEAENRLSPAEVADLAAEATTLPEPARAWVGRLAAMCARIGGPMQPFRRRDIAANVSFYEGAGPPGAPRRLIVTFTGVGMRPMMPTAPVLQGLPAQTCDVLMLRDSDRLAFLRGVPGYAADLPGLAARLEAEFPPAGYADRRCLGTSSGGAAALAFGVMTGARLALSLGGAHWRSLARRAGAGAVDHGTLDGLFAAAPMTATRLVCAHGERAHRDSVRSRLLAMAVPGCRVLVVRGVAEHAILGGLVLPKALGRFLEEILLGDTLPADGVWQP
jgi:hypothetical protein